MFDPSLFVRSALIGMAIAAPVGPMSVLCMKTTLTRGARHGMAIGAGIALGDGIYAAVAALGLAGLSGFMLAHQQPLHLAAGLFLLWLGLKALMRRDPGADAPAALAPRNPLRDLAAAVLLTLTNPPTIIMFSAVFAALTPAAGFRLAEALSTVAGVVAGSLIWWAMVVGVTSTLRSVLGPRLRLWIDRVSGLALAGLGLVEVGRGLKG